MKIIVKHRHRKGSESFTDAINIYSPKKQGQMTDLLRDLWEREYNSWDLEPDRDLSWFEEDHARIENDIYITEFIITNLLEVEI